MSIRCEEWSQNEGQLIWGIRPLHKTAFHACWAVLNLVLLIHQSERAAQSVQVVPVWRRQVALAVQCSSCSSPAHQEVQADVSFLGQSLELGVLGGVGRDLWAVRVSAEQWWHWADEAPCGDVQALPVQSWAILSAWFYSLIEVLSKQFVYVGYTWFINFCVPFSQRVSIYEFMALLKLCHFHLPPLSWEATATGVIRLMHLTWEISEVLGRRRENLCVCILIWSQFKPQEKVSIDYNTV